MRRTQTDNHGANGWQDSRCEYLAIETDLDCPQLVAADEGIFWNIDWIKTQRIIHLAFHTVKNAWYAWRPSPDRPYKVRVG